MNPNITPVPVARLMDAPTANLPRLPGRPSGEAHEAAGRQRAVPGQKWRPCQLLGGRSGRRASRRRRRAGGRGSALARSRGTACHRQWQQQKQQARSEDCFPRVTNGGLPGDACQVQLCLFRQWSNCCRGAFANFVVDLASLLRQAHGRQRQQRRQAEPLGQPGDPGQVFRQARQGWRRWRHDRLDRQPGQQRR